MALALLGPVVVEEAGGLNLAKREVVVAMVGAAQAAAHRALPPHRVLSIRVAAVVAPFKVHSQGKAAQAVPA